MSEANTENRAEQQARAQVESIVSMVAALECDYDRLEELRDKAKEGHWVAGWNMPGYMPDSEPVAFDTCGEARQYIEEEMRDRAGQAMQDESRSNEATDAEEAAFVSAADRMKVCIEEKQDAEYGETVVDVHFWIQKVDGRIADEAEQLEFEELEAAAGDCTDEDDARQRISGDPLSIEVRSDWCSPGEEMTAGEFRIVLCTGGPHVEIQGDLSDGEPSRARILYRDWGTSGELYEFDRDAVLTYCREFFAG